MQSKTLFLSGELGAQYFRGSYHDEDISVEFMACADTQLSAYFIKHSGLKPGINVSVSWPNEKLFYTKSEVSEMPINIYINHNWNPAKMKWKSKSGRIYDKTDTDIDCDDIIFWFEDLDPPLYFKQLYPNQQLPFKLKYLTYELVVLRLNLECELDLFVKDASVADIPSLIERIDAHMHQFNEQSEKKDREDGVVHHWKTTVEDNRIEYVIDMGSAGFTFMKKLLRFLSKLNAFDKVEIG